ncbi:peptidyl-prolyl cis-trans isomerase G-like [Ptychodera flava]|uniref:peptidyl-prolyl cis-trans isomerase G-like n=1 Tax=Ptychodera flava TaxID=63121 RepID=UPI00396A3B35
MAQGYHQLIERAPPTTFVADRQQESPYRHHNSDYHQQDNYRANQRLPSSEFSALPYNKSRDAININENIWRGSDPPDIDYRRHQSWHSHLQSHPSREERVKQDSRSPSKSQMKHHQKQTPADKQTPQNDNDRRRERSRNENSKRNIPYTEKQHQRTDNNNSQVREALSEYVKNQYRNKDYKTAKDRYREETAQYNADGRRRSQDHRIHKNPVKETKPARLPALSEKPKQTQSIANDAYMTQSSNNPEHQKGMMFQGQHEKYGPTKRQYKSADDLYEDNALPGFQVKLRVRDNEGTLGDEIFYYSSTSLFQEETDI